MNAVVVEKQPEIKYFVDEKILQSLIGKNKIKSKRLQKFLTVKPGKKYFRMYVKNGK